MSGENRKFMMKWDFPDESSDCHVISDELVWRPTQLWRDVITNSYCVNDMRLLYDLGQPQNATAVA